MKPPLATVGSFSEFFLDGMMDDDDDDARFCLNRSSDDDGRRACPSVSAMAACRWIDLGAESPFPRAARALDTHSARE